MPIFSLEIFFYTGTGPNILDLCHQHNLATDFLINLARLKIFKYFVGFDELKLSVKKPKHENYEAMKMLINFSFLLVFPDLKFFS